MQRNGARYLRQPCLAAQWLVKPPPYRTGRWYSDISVLDEASLDEASLDEATLGEATASKPPVINKEEATLMLQKLDQKRLSEARESLEQWIAAVEKSRAKIESLPTTVRLLPEIPAYTLGYPRHVSRRSFPDAADKTVKAAKHLREHLIDLKYEAYEGTDDSALKREIAGMSEAEKRAAYVAVQNEVTAMKTRLPQRAQQVTKLVTEMIARHKRQRGAPMPEFATSKAEEEEDRVEMFKDLITEGKRVEDWGRAASVPEQKPAERKGWADTG